MAKMFNCGITIEVQPGEIGFYKKAGYVLVEEPAPATTEPDEDSESENPEETKKTRRGK